MEHFSLLSNHGSTLLLVAKNSRVRVNHIADKLGVTEGAARRIIADLIGANLLQQHREGRSIYFDIEDSLRGVLLVIEDAAQLIDRPKEAQANDKRHQMAVQLWDAASKLTKGERSFWELSVDQLISEAGISRSKFYAYFEDKGALIEVLLKSFLQDMWTAFDRLIALPADATKDDLIVSLRATLKVYKPYRHLLATTSEADKSYTNISNLYRQLMNDNIGLITKQINTRKGRGNEGDAQWFASLLTWGTEHGLNNFFASASDEAALEPLIISLADIIWRIAYADTGDGS